MTETKAELTDTVRTKAETASAAVADTVRSNADAAKPELVKNKDGASRPTPDTRTPAQIESDLVATRERLAGRLDELQAYVAPRAVLRREVEHLKRFYVDEFGGIRPERVAATAAVVVAVLALAARRRRSRR